MIIDPDDYRFTMLEVTGEDSPSADSANLRNWMSRGVFEVGRKHKLGRWLFSLTDVVRVRAVLRLVSLSGISPTEANNVANLTVERYRELVKLDKNGKPNLLKLLKPNSLFGRMEIYMSSPTCIYVAVYGDDEKLEFVKEDHFSFEEFFGGRDQSYIFFPVDQFIARIVIDKTMRAYEEEFGDWDAIPFPDLYENFHRQWSIEALIAHYQRSYVRDGED